MLLKCSFAVWFHQTKIQELETSIEVKDNEFSRAFKASKKTGGKRVILIIDDNFNSSIEIGRAHV